jgi:hypothetical protein
MVVTLQLVLSASAQRVSDAYGGPPGVVDQAKNIPYRQLLLSTSGAAAAIGGSAGVTAATGLPIALTAAPLSLGPFSTGPLKLSDLYAIGAGATLTILGVPF